MKYLVAVDGSDTALRALDHVLALGRAGLPIELVLANVQPPASLYEVVVAHDPDVLAQVALEAAAHALDSAEAHVRAAGLDCQREVAVGQPGTMLVELAEDHGCDALVLGLAPGPVIGQVLQIATLPVTVVPAAEDLPVEPAGIDDPAEALRDPGV